MSWVYELTVDGASRGSWVVTTAGGTASGWAFLEPGQPVPMPRAQDARPDTGSLPHDAPDLEAWLPRAIADRALAVWSARGQRLLRSLGGSADQIASIRAQVAALGVDLDDLIQATAGRVDTRRDPPYLVFAYRIPLGARDVLGSYALQSAGFKRAIRPGDFVDREIAGKRIGVGPASLIRQDRHEHGRPYLYQPEQPDDLVVVVVTDDEAWAAEAIGQLP